jgi:hypothetical protein
VSSAKDDAHFSALALRVIPTLSSSAPTMHLQQGACGCHSSHQVAQASLDWSVHHAGKLEDSALVLIRRTQAHFALRATATASRCGKTSMAQGVALLWS